MSLNLSGHRFRNWSRTVEFRSESFRSPKDEAGVQAIVAKARGDKHVVLHNATEIFERFEPLMKEFEGRPHWGKHLNLTRNEVAAMYPRHGDFVDERRRRDPDGVFLNTLLRRLLA